MFLSDLLKRTYYSIHANYIDHVTSLISEGSMDTSFFLVCCLFHFCVFLSLLIFFEFIVLCWKQFFSLVEKKKFLVFYLCLVWHCGCIVCMWQLVAVSFFNFQVTRTTNLGLLFSVWVLLNASFCLASELHSGQPAWRHLFFQCFFFSSFQQ